MYQAEIEFRYTVDGKEYTTPSSSPYRSSSYAEIKQKAKTYARGTTHPIRYNPADPNDIRFDAGCNFGFFFLPVMFGGMAIIFGGVGAGLLPHCAASLSALQSLANFTRAPPALNCPAFSGRINPYR